MLVDKNSRFSSASKSENGLFLRADSKSESLTRKEKDNLHNAMNLIVYYLDLYVNQVIFLGGVANIKQKLWRWEIIVSEATFDPPNGTLP